MERRRISRGERNQKLSVKALGQMFEELIRLTQTTAGLSQCSCKLHSVKYTNDQDRDRRINGTLARIIRPKDILETGQSVKPTTTGIDGKHVKNRKQFFEEQAHAAEISKNVKHKAEIDIRAPINNRYSSTSNKVDRPYLTSFKSPTIVNSVKTTKQLFEKYINGNESSKISPSKSTENLHYRPRHHDDYTSSSANLNGYIGGQKSTTMNDLLYRKFDEAPRRYHLKEDNVNCNGTDSANDLSDQNLTKQITNERKVESSSDEDDEKDFVEYQNLPPPPTDLLKVVQKDLFYQNLLPQLYDGKPEDEAKESKIKPTARLVEIEDNAEEGNLIDTSEKNQVNDANARSIFNVSTATITPTTVSSSKKEEGLIHEDVNSSSKEKPIHNTELEWQIHYGVEKGKENGNPRSNSDRGTATATPTAVFSSKYDEEPFYVSAASFEKDEPVQKNDDKQEIQDGGEEGNLIDISEENEATKPTTRCTLDITAAPTTFTAISRSQDEEEPFYVNMTSFREEEPIQKNEVEQGIADETKEGNLIDISEENEVSKSNAGSNLNISITPITPVTASSSIDEEEPFYENAASFTKKEQIQENNVEEQENLKESNETNEDSANNIEECISDVTEAFQSIQTLCNQPKWTVWDMAKQMHRFERAEDDCDIFGTLLDIDSDYCVETINNGNENVLFRISIGREVLMQEPEDFYLLADDSFYNEEDSNEKVAYEEPEYYFISDTTYDNEKDMSGTFFDKNKNPRIEIIGGNKNQGTSMPQLKLPKLQSMIIKELIDSEESYLKRMRYIIDNYLIYFRNMKISSDIDIVFGNIEELYTETEKVYSAFKESQSLDEIARVFLANVHLFDCYTEYLRNKSKSQQYAEKSFADIIKKRQLELEDQYTCESYLLNSIHRPEQYKLILERLKKAVTRNGESFESLDEAILLLERKMAESNTALAMDSIKYSPCGLKELGPFLMKEKFHIKNKYTSVVFLFQGGVVFCVEDQGASNQFEYVEHIEMEKLLLRHYNTSTSFQLSCFDKSKKYGEKNYDYDIEASTMAIKEKWVDEIQRILWVQLQYYKDQQKNATQNRTKHTSKPEIAQNTEYNEVEYNEYEQVTYSNGNTYENVSNDIKGAVLEEESVYCAIDENIYECAEMSGTFFDKDEIPRIEIIRAESVPNDNVYLQNVPRPQYMIIKELINTEETYLRKMRHIIDDYYIHFKNSGVPPDISIVFGNIEDIYEVTEKLYKSFLDCNSVEDIAKVFLTNTSIFDHYTDYLRNKSISYYYANTKFKELIKARQLDLEDQYTCDSYLLNPVQRPGRYKLLLEKLEKELDSIKKCPINLKKMGPFIMKETFNIKRKYKSVMFLFREIVIFCVEHQRRSDTYIYKDSIEMTELSISHNRSSTTFQLKNFDKFKFDDDVKYIFDVETPSMSVKERWIDEIQRLLWGQLQYFKDQQKTVTEVNTKASPLRRNQSIRVKDKPYDSPSRTQKRSTFYYDIPSVH
ncbi:hypothetical protein Trydic_g13429 [Trypoxylus dichotomus]